MAMTASVAVVGNVIVNRPSTCVLTISNSGSDAVNVSSIQPKVFGQDGNNVSAGSVYVSPVFVPVNQAVASTTGMQNSIQVGGTSSVYVPFQLVVLGPVIQTDTAAQGGANFLVSADCATSDGTVFVAPSIPLAVTTPQQGQPQPNPDAGPGEFGGELQFNEGANSALIL